MLALVIVTSVTTVVGVAAWSEELALVAVVRAAVRVWPVWMIGWGAGCSHMARKKCVL